MLSYAPSSPILPSASVKSRYHAKPIEVKEKIKQKARDRYKKDPSKTRKNIYFKMIQSGYIKKPSQRCLDQYGITWDNDTQAYVVH